ncbi:uncharacterized protein LOC118434155 [Folsomia candida]|uniref:ER-bound oxygenase mpaB/mpaB'/Rubber oxygenase catalytic domain-containing protein n=1 Tax=Folsomia candida TaxID=158441 RepID=A0A226EWS6_FOLCA|nr:uncharacterized protein LOC118434155 [Folsomia candida]OXA62063.1 hypothetical protein Fcan01_00712 [Folsomia candida]
MVNHRILFKFRISLPRLPRCVTNVGKFWDGVHIQQRTQTNDTDIFPPWMNATLALEGQKLALGHVDGIVKAYLEGILIALTHPQIRDALLFSGNSDTPSKSGRRYAATIVQIALWFRRDLNHAQLDSNWVVESVRKVRQIHDHVSLRIRKALNDGTYHGRVRQKGDKLINTELWRAFQLDLEESHIPRSDRSYYPNENIFETEFKNAHPFNQLTLAVTQWTFLGSVAMDPESVNVYNATEEGLMAFICGPFWATRWESGTNLIWD